VFGAGIIDPAGTLSDNGKAAGLAASPPASDQSGEGYTALQA
jgi:hypothetical protein